MFAGSFVYHAAHQHIHFDDLALYTLQPDDAPGASKRTSAKTTFCIMDTDHIAPDLAGSPSKPGTPRVTLIFRACQLAEGIRTEIIWTVKALT